MEYDWRTRFHCGLDTIGADMSIGEAVRLVRILRADPSSMTAAAAEGWKHPVTLEALVAMDSFDLTAMVNSKKKPKPHPLRPWADKPAVEQRGDRAGRSSAEVLALVRPPA